MKPVPYAMSLSTELLDELPILIETRLLRFLTRRRLSGGAEKNDRRMPTAERLWAGDVREMSM
jgi:hypothetical protein